MTVADGLDTRPLRAQARAGEGSESGLEPGSVTEPSKGPLASEPRWKTALRAANAAPRCGATRKRGGGACRGAAMANGRCRLHGGKSTGPSTADGLERCRQAPRKHGGRDAEARQAAKDREEAMRLVRELCR
ncbi:MAG TPA: HGGxSTG domain-containing protein [Acidisphaera sp.]|nr:HGGxSTG domain-containing protein [Acidisphaera sp.]